MKNLLVITWTLLCLVAGFLLLLLAAAFRWRWMGERLVYAKHALVRLLQEDA